MNQGLYVVLPLVFFFILDCIILIAGLKEKDNSRSKKLFIWFTVSVMISQGLTAITYACDEKLISLNHGLQYLFNFISLTSMSLASDIWFQYLYTTSSIYKKTESKIIRIAGLLPVIILFILGSVSPWTHWIMYIDESGVYHTGSLGFFQFLPYLYTLFAISLAIKEKIKGHKDVSIMRKFPLYVIPSLIGAFINTFIIRGGYTQMGCSFGVILMYLQQYMVEVNDSKKLKSIESLYNQLQLISDEREYKQSLLNTLSKGYLNIFILNPKNKQVSILKSSEFVQNYVKEENQCYDYEVLSKRYIKDRVYKDDVEMMLRVMDIDNILNRMKETDEYVGTYRVVDNDEIHYYQYKYAKVLGNDSIIVGFHNVDAMIIAEREQQEKLKKALADAQNANEAKSRFLSNMSHDIRTPMNAIIGYSEMIRKAADNKEKVLDYQGKLHSSSELLLQIINNVLDMSRIESGKMVLDEDYFHSGNFLEEIVGVFAPTIKEKNLKVVCEEQLENRHILMDKVKVHELLNNLISNAVKYTPEGGSIMCKTVELPSDKKGYVLYETTIEDTGIGMSKEFLPTLFDSFSREKNTTTGKVAGAGLGMSIVKALIDVMGGTIDVESELGKETKFTIHLYHKIADEIYYTENKKPVEIDINNFKGKRILLAEDNELNTEIATAILEEVGFVIDHASDGVICVDLIEKAEPDHYSLILMDIQMPNMDGFTATRTIRHLSSPKKAHIPIIAMTANAFEEDRKNAIKNGMDGHVSKPIDIAKLMNILGEILSKK